MCLIPYKKNGNNPEGTCSSTCKNFAYTENDSAGPSDLEFQNGRIRLIEGVYPEDLE